MTNTTDSKSMSKSHVIRVPQEFAQELWRKFNTRNDVLLFDSWRDVLNCAAQWGHDQREPEIQQAVDQMLDACCDWVSKYLPYLGDFPMPEDKLRAAMRPKPPSLAEQGLGVVHQLKTLGNAVDLDGNETRHQLSVLESALNRLAELENQQ
jgi:hypothetical protein